MVTRSFTVISIAAFTLIAVGCAAESDPEESGAGSSEEALSQAACDQVVPKALEQAKKDCQTKGTNAESAAKKIATLGSNVVAALNGYQTAIDSYNGSNQSAIDAATRECSAVQCSGTLQTDGVKAECGLERTLLQGACYVRHAPAIQASIKGLDLTRQGAALDQAVDALSDQWFSLAKQTVTLTAEHAACSTYAGSNAQRSALNATCRASCNANAPTSVGGAIAGTGMGSACTPPNYEDVKDDVGNLVACGKMGRAFLALACECAPSNRCIQFGALAGSSERGKPCATGPRGSGFKKVVWNSATGVASLECR